MYTNTQNTQKHTKRETMDCTSDTCTQATPSLVEIDWLEIPAALPQQVQTAARSKQSKAKRSTCSKQGPTAAKRKSYTVKQKIETLEQIELHKYSYGVAAEKLNIPKSTLLKWKKEFTPDKRRSIVSTGSIHVRRLRQSTYPLINKLMQQFIRKRYELSLTSCDAVSTSWALLQARATRIRDELVSRGHQEYASFKASAPWLQGVLKHMNFSGTKLHGEGGSVDEKAAEVAMAKFIQQLASYRLESPDQVFNMDETGLFYGQISTYSVVPSGELLVARGTKRMTAKDRVTVLACVSCSGERLPLLVVGKFSKPRCFKDDPVECYKSQVLYTNQANAWVDTTICQTWFDTVFVPTKRRLLGHKLAVLVWDNCSAHRINNTYPDVVIEFLPPNLTSRHQLLDQGVLSVLKSRYKKHLVETLDNVLDNWDQRRTTAKQRPAGCAGIFYGSKPTMSDVCRILFDCWKQVQPDCIINCALKANFLPRKLNAILRTKTTKGREHVTALRSFLSQETIPRVDTLFEKYKRLHLDLSAAEEALEDLRQFDLQCDDVISTLRQLTTTEKELALMAQQDIEDNPNIQALIIDEQLLPVEDDVAQALLELQVGACSPDITEEGLDAGDAEIEAAAACEPLETVTYEEATQGLAKIAMYLRNTNSVDRICSIVREALFNVHEQRSQQKTITDFFKK